MFLSFFVQLSTGHASSDGFDGYRFNPFQFPYPEYRYKAKTIPLSQLRRQDGATASISFFGFSALIPERYAGQVEESGESVVIRSMKKRGILISREKESLMGCEEGRDIYKDFCSAFTSTQDFYQKLFTLVPEDLAKDEYAPIGYSWIVHRKGVMFSRVSKILIYEDRKSVV